MDALRAKKTKAILRRAEEQKLYFLNADDDISKSGFNSFIAAGVYSLPVVNKHGRIIGLLDHADFARLVIQIFTASDAAPKMTVRHVMNLSGRDRLVQVLRSSTIKDVLDQLVTQKVHRLIVQDERDASKQVLLSQLDVAAWFCDRLPKEVGSLRLSRMGRKKLLSYETQSLVTAADHDSVLYAVQLMDRHGITAIPVVSGPERKLVGSLSLKDVPSGLDHLFESCGTFSQRIGGPVHDLACVELDATFQDLLLGFKSTKYHRFWIVGPDRHLLGVVSLTDVMRVLRNL